MFDCKCLMMKHYETLCAQRRHYRKSFLLEFIYIAQSLILLCGGRGSCLETWERIEGSRSLCDAAGSRRTNLSHLGEAKLFIIPHECLSVRRADQAN